MFSTITNTRLSTAIMIVEKINDAMISLAPQMIMCYFGLHGRKNLDLGSTGKVAYLKCRMCGTIIFGG
jgi:hypothetical protein